MRFKEFLKEALSNIKAANNRKVPVLIQPNGEEIYLMIKNIFASSYPDNNYHQLGGWFLIEENKTYIWDRSYTAHHLIASAFAFYENKNIAFYIDVSRNTEFNYLEELDIQIANYSGIRSNKNVITQLPWFTELKKLARKDKNNHEI